MNTLRNEKGFALAFVLILAAISLVMTLAMMLMVSRGSYVSGQQKRFRTAVEAGLGGIEAAFDVISNRGTLSAMYVSNVGLAVNNDNALATKLGQPTANWGVGADNTSTIDPNSTASFDMRIDLAEYRVYSKIVDTVEGNSGADEGLLKTGVVNAGSGEVTVVSVPYLYTIEVLSQSRVNPTERSKISVLYQY